MDWKQSWINEVLTEVPAGGFRERMEAELRDHLESRCAALTEAGRRPEEARAEALRAMGEPEKLKAEYKAAWERTPGSRLLGAMGYVGALLFGGMVLYAAYVLMEALFIILPSAAERWETWEAWLESGTFRFFAGALSFWVPFALEAALLRRLLGSYRRRGALIAAGLLITWALGTVLLIYFCLEMGEYSQYGLLPPTWAERLALFYGDMQHSNAPWITPGYHVMNIAGCGLLGWIFRRRRGGKEKTAA